jgi:hypothetical protein
MAITFETSTPNKLLAAFKKAIDDGRVVTWAIDSDGDFYHTPDQWKSLAYLTASVVEGERLMLNFFTRTTKASKAAYGVYHGRFIESMLTHCDELFTIGTASAAPTNSDVVSLAA